MHSEEIYVRRLETADFDFVRDLAAKQANFTIPPPYVLWLLQRTSSVLCLVAETRPGTPVAYLLGLVDMEQRSIYVWQLAASDVAPAERASVELLRRIRAYAESAGIEALLFSAVPDSASFRLIRRYSLAVFSAEPEFVATLSPTVAPHEQEYVVKLGRSATRP